MSLGTVELLFCMGLLGLTAVAALVYFIRKQ